MEGESGDQETPKAASSPRTLLFLERVPIAPIAGARLTWAMMLSVRSEPELRGEREKVTGALVSFPRKGLSSPHALGGGVAPGTTATHQVGRAQTADEEGTDAHARDRAVLRGSVQRKRPGQPSPTLPRHATPLLRPHTHQGPAPSYDALQAQPCPSH